MQQIYIVSDIPRGSAFVEVIVVMITKLMIHNANADEKDDNDNDKKMMTNSEYFCDDDVS